MTTKAFLQTPIRQYIRQLEQLREQAALNGQSTEHFDNQLSTLYVQRDLGVGWVEMPMDSLDNE